MFETIAIIAIFIAIYYFFNKRNLESERSIRNVKAALGKFRSAQHRRNLAAKKYTQLELQENPKLRGHDPALQIEGIPFKIQVKVKDVHSDGKVFLLGYKFKQSDLWSGQLTAPVEYCRNLKKGDVLKLRGKIKSAGYTSPKPFLIINLYNATWGSWNMDIEDCVLRGPGRS